MSEEVKKEKAKGPIGKLKDKIEDADEQLAVLSTLVRLGILVWSGGILTLQLCDHPWIATAEDRSDLHCQVYWRLAFGVQTAKKSGDGTMKMNGAGAAGAVTKADMEKLIEKATQAARSSHSY